MRYRKKPVIVDAIQVADIRRKDLPAWLAAATRDGTVHIIPSVMSDAPAGVKIRTLEGVMAGGHDDWIVRGVKGEIYPVKPDIFEATYEPVTTE